MCMCSLRKLLNIKNGKSGVCDSLAKYCSRVVLKCGVKLLFGSCRAYEGNLDPHLCHSNGDKVKGSAVDG